MRQTADGGTMPPEIVKERMAEREFQYNKLDELHRRLGFTFVAEGGANGADTTAFWWRKSRGVPGDTWKADWKQHGKSAGPIRNQLMLFESKAELVIAFPGGTGTADMVKKAKTAGVDVIEVEYNKNNDASPTTGSRSESESQGVSR
jgi:hypothetical protein